MTIQNSHLDLGNGYRLRVSGLDWILDHDVTRKERKTGEEYTGTEIVGYYSDLGPACRQHFRDMIMRLGEHQTLEKLIVAIEDCEARITAAVESCRVSDREEAA